MRTKYVVLALAIVLAAITPLWAIPEVPILEVDTLAYLGKGVAGEAAGAFFLPDGNVIAVWNDTPYIIDSKSGVILRTLEKSPIGTLCDLEVSKDGSKLLTRAMGPKLTVWDIQTGKNSFPLEKQIDYFCISPDGTKLYVTLPNKTDNPGLIVVYDMNTFQEIERLSYPKLIWGGHIDISPDGQTLAVEVGKEKNGQTDTKTNQLILINLNDKKNYTVVETAEPSFTSIQFSPDGKQIASLYNDGNTNLYIYIYNLETKEKKYIRNKELSVLFVGSAFNAMSKPFFIEPNLLTMEIELLDHQRYHFTWNITENRLKNYINLSYNRSIEMKDDLILLCNYYGVIGFLDKNIVPVKDNIISAENYLTYANNQLEFNSEQIFGGNISVYDTTGKTIVNNVEQTFKVGKNLIQFNTPTKGVYIITISGNNQLLSYKFIVE